VAKDNTVRYQGLSLQIPQAPCVRIDVVRVFTNLGARDERFTWK